MINLHLIKEASISETAHIKTLYCTFPKSVPHSGQSRSFSYAESTFFSCYCPNIFLFSLHVLSSQQACALLGYTPISPRHPPPVSQKSFCNVLPYSKNLLCGDIFRVTDANCMVVNFRDVVLKNSVVLCNFVCSVFSQSDM